MAKRDSARPPESCTGSELLRWMGMPEEADAATDALRFSTRWVRAGRSLVLEGGLFKSLYFVLEGSFKCIQTHADGHEQVHSFPGRGDVIGLDGMREGCYASGAVALEDARVAVLPFRDWVRLEHAVPALQRLLHRGAEREAALRRRSLQAREPVVPEARLACFLWQMAEQQGEEERPALQLRLAMSRRDIASHLGLSLDGVSRGLKALEEEGCIAVRPGEVELLDLAALEWLQQGTRSPADPVPN